MTEFRRKKVAVVLINLGSPESPKPSDVYTYLTEFLNDPRVIDISWIGRKILVNGIIVPFRHRKSARIYEKLWTENGSPLIHWGNRVKDLLQEKFSKEEAHETKVFLGMRYQHPSMESVLSNARKWNPDKIILIPLFPQYASASTGSVIDKAMRILRDLWTLPEIQFVTQFWDHPGFLDAIAERGRAFNMADYDHILFSYHGLPQRHLNKIHDNKDCSQFNCKHEVNDHNKFCYQATCYATTREIVKRLNIHDEKFTVSFQSRLGKGWVEPFTDEVITDLAKKGAKKLLIFSPAFIADCLETTIEIGVEYDELFKERGGEKVQLVPSLNDHPIWIAALEQMVRNRF